MTVPDILRNHVNSISPLSDATWSGLSSLFMQRTLERRELFAPPGRVTTTVGLLESGYIRAFFTTEQGSEYNKHIFVAPAIIGDYASLLSGDPVQIPQQTLTRCVVWVADYRRVLELEHRFVELSVLSRRFAELMYLQKEQRELELATMSARDRYLRLRRRYPDIERAIPQYEIASYLGVTPTQLSRIRAHL